MTDWCSYDGGPCVMKHSISYCPGCRFYKLDKEKQMKDTDKVELTVGNIKAAAEKCGTAKEVLKTLCPEVFKESPPEWEDVTRLAYVSPWGEQTLLLCVNDDNSIGKDSNWGHRETIDLIPGETLGKKSGRLEIRGGRIWRKKSR